MIFEALRRLDRLVALPFYRYVGFGSPYFVDFRIAHRELGITNMVNVEHEGDEPRFNFNRPFGGISLEFGESGDVLDRLDWTGPSIVWLDYDKRLSHFQLADVELVISKMAPGSVILITTSAQPEEDLASRVASFNERLGDYMPFGLTDPELLGGWRTAELYCKILQELLATTIKVRNEGAQANAVLRYRQWFNFHYSDGTRMLTVGGILIDAGRDAHVDGLGMGAFPFVREGPEAYRIEVPQLTLGEMAYLERAFPCEPNETGLSFLSDGEIRSYQEIYRYYPRFAHVDI